MTDARWLDFACDALLIYGIAKIMMVAVEVAIHFHFKRRRS